MNLGLFDDQKFKKNQEVSLKTTVESIFDKEKIFSVSELINYLNEFFGYLGVIKVKGEIIEVNSHSKGYSFFTIKDSETKEHLVECFASSWVWERISYLVEVGFEVVVKAIPEIYKNGRFRLKVKEVFPYGEGALKKAFEILKKELEAKGYFDPSRKKPIPEFIQKIGLLTSENGAAIKDFLKNLGQYGFKIYFLDIRVEGDYAEESIVAGIKWFNKNMPDLDVLVLIRGGGSLEELKAFNSKEVAESIILSRLPVITGIGHEKDQTIADYCADLSLSTPTLVATFIKNQREILLEKVSQFRDELIEAMKFFVDENKKLIFDFKKELEFNFISLMNNRKLILSELKEALYNKFNQIFNLNLI